MAFGNAYPKRRAELQGSGELGSLIDENAGPFPRDYANEYKSHAPRETTNPIGKAMKIVVQSLRAFCFSSLAELGRCGVLASDTAPDPLAISS